MSTGGVVGTSEVLFPGTADVFVAFRCFDNVREVYPIRAFSLTMKVHLSCLCLSLVLRRAFIRYRCCHQALSISKESFVRINGDGVLCAQHQVSTRVGDVLGDAHGPVCVRRYRWNRSETE